MRRTCSVLPHTRRALHWRVLAEVKERWLGPLRCLTLGEAVGRTTPAFLPVCVCVFVSG